jgi:SP family sugar:H+ symporter-like MFS transporter
LSILCVGLILNGCKPILRSSVPFDIIDEGNVISGLQAFPAWQEDLNYPTGARLGALNACGQIAGLVVGPVIAYIDEHYGRKWGIRCESPLTSLVYIMLMSVYGYCLVIGTVIGCIAGVPGVNGYARMSSHRRPESGTDFQSLSLVESLSVSDLPHSS